MTPRALMGLAFFPRGGSAHVARSLARALPGAGWDVTVLSGSLSMPGRPGDAGEFYRGLDVRPLDMTAALYAPNPMLADPPLHPSFEDRPAGQDRVFASLDDAGFEHHSRAWARALADAGAADADVLHLHHLTPLNAAAALVAPDVPVVGHLHGTELLMLEAIELTPDAGRTGRSGRSGCGLGGRVRAADRALGLPDRARRAAARHRSRTLRARANGFDPTIFRAREVDRRRLAPARWSSEPRGWAPGEEAGSVRYEDSDLAGFASGEGPVLLYVGRYTEVKRIDVLIEAYARARPGFTVAAPLVLVGGFPGEWEGEHPLETIGGPAPRRVPRGLARHEELPDLLAASDVVVLPGARAVRAGAGRGEPGAAAIAVAPRAGGDRPPRRDGLAGGRPTTSTGSPLRSARGRLTRGAPPPRRAAAEDARRATPGRRWPAGRRGLRGGRRRPAQRKVARIRQRRCYLSASAASAHAATWSTSCPACRGRPARLAFMTQATSTTPAASPS